MTVQAAMVDIPPPPTKAPVMPPEDDPRFARATTKAGAVARKEKKHAPAKTKAAEAQKAAVPPANDASSQAAAAQVGKMDAQKPGEFNKKAFIDAVTKAVDAATPKDLSEADEFKKSGKAGEVKNQVSGMVTQDKQRAEQGIKEKTAEPPDTSVAVKKPVTPLPAEKPGPGAASVGAAAAMPEKRPASETDLRNGPAEVKNEMAEADVTEDQLKKSNEPEFDKAVEAKGEAEAHSKEAPAAYRAEESQALGGAKAGAAGDERTKLAGIHQGRAGALGKVAKSKEGTKSEDEVKRAEVATKIDGIFAKTKTEVTAILDGIEGKMTPVFESGEKSARNTFEAYVAGRMSAYKRKRYGGFGGGLKWAKDKLFSMPSEVNTFYVEGKKLYLGLMTGVISRVADVVGGELNRAKARIAQGRNEVKTYVEGLPKNLKKVGQQAQSKMEDQFASLESDVDSKQEELVSALAEKYTEARGALDERITALQEENKGLVTKAVDAVKGVIQTILKLKDMLLGVLARAASAIGKIIKDPIGFLGNLVNAVKAGVMLFKDNILVHLGKGLMGWLFGQLAAAGIELPKSFDLKGILGLVLQILGLTYANIRARAVSIVGEKVVAGMEKAVEVFKILVTEGPVGLWNMIKEKVGDLKEAIMGPMTEFIMTKVVVAGITWLISLLNPASAFIKACKAIYDIVMFFVERAAQIKAFVDSVLDSIESIASGGAGGVAKLIEGTLSKMIPILISFLAALLGVGGIGEKIKSVIAAIQKPVNQAIDFILKGALKLGKKLFGGAKKLFAKGKAWVKGKTQKAKDYLKKKAAAGHAWAKKKLGLGPKGSDLRSPQQREEDMTHALAAADALIADSKLSIKVIKDRFRGIKSKHGLTSLELVVDKKDKERETLHAVGAMSPSRPTATRQRDFAGDSSARLVVITSNLKLPRPRKRKHLERELPSRGEYAPGTFDDAERAHAMGRITGPESGEGIRLATREVNQVLQARGIEKMIQAIGEKMRDDPKYEALPYRTVIRMVPGTLRLQSIEYRLDGVIEGKVTPILQASITLEWGKGDATTRSTAVGIDYVGQDFKELLVGIAEEIPMFKNRLEPEEE